MPKTRNEILEMNIARNKDDLWFSESEYNDLKEIYELTKVSHTEMCDTVIKLRKYIERHKSDVEQLQKEL